MRDHYNVLLCTCNPIFPNAIHMAANPTTCSKCYPSVFNHKPHLCISILLHSTRYIGKLAVFACMHDSMRVNTIYQSQKRALNGCWTGAHCLYIINHPCCFFIKFHFPQDEIQPTCSLPLNSLPTQQLRASSTFLHAHVQYICIVVKTIPSFLTRVLGNKIRQPNM